MDKKEEAKASTELYKSLTRYFKTPTLKKDFFIHLLNHIAKQYASNVYVMTVEDYIDLNKKSLSKDEIKRRRGQSGWADFDEKTNQHDIILNPKYNNYPGLVCTLFHELGHVHYKHYQIRNDGRKITDSLVERQEMEATVWAHDELVKRTDIFDESQEEQLHIYFTRALKEIKTASLKELDDTGVLGKETIIRALEVKTTDLPAELFDKRLKHRHKSS